MTVATLLGIVVLACAQLVVANQSWATESLLTINVNNQGDISGVYDADGSVVAEPLKMPIDVNGLHLKPIQSLSFAEVLMANGATVAWCRPCGGRWCRVWLDELRYFLDGGAQVIGVQGRVGDKWLDLRLDYPIEYGAEEQPEVLDKILSLKTHALVALEDDNGNRHGIVISGIRVSSEGVDGTDLSMWSRR